MPSFTVAWHLWNEYFSSKIFSDSYSQKVWHVVKFSRLGCIYYTKFRTPEPSVFGSFPTFIEAGRYFESFSSIEVVDRSPSTMVLALRWTLRTVAKFWLVIAIAQRHVLDVMGQVCHTFD